MTTFLIGIFAFATLGVALLILIRLVGSFGRNYDDAETGRQSIDQEGDFLFIFFPMLKILGKLGFFRAIERMHDIALGIVAEVVLAVKRMRDEYKNAALDVLRVRLAKYLYHHPSTREHKATTSFFLKDIAEYKRKLNAERE